jgi:hypothetical protein
MIIATSKTSMTAISDICGHGAENCLKATSFKNQSIQMGELKVNCNAGQCYLNVNGMKSL